MIGLSSKKVITLFLDIVIIISLMITMSFSPESYDAMFLYATAIYIVFVVSWLIIKKSFINYFNLFIILTYLYGFGQYLVEFFDMRMYFQYNINNIFTPKEINETALYYLINVALLHFSVIIFDEYLGLHKNKLKIVKNNTFLNKLFTFDELHTKVFNFVAFAVLAISFVCEVILLVKKIQINLTQGYAVALSYSISSEGFVGHVINFVSTLFLPAIFATLISSKGKKSNVIVWGCYFIFLVLYFLSGSRFEAVISLAGVFLLYNNYYRQIKTKYIVIVAVCGIFVLYLSALITNIRIISRYGDAPKDFIELVSAAMKLTGQSGFISNIISTTGFQICAIAGVYLNCPSEIDYTYGLYYIGGLARVIPNIFGGENPLITQSIDEMFAPFVTKTYGMGSSFIIEAYYNFGKLGTLMMIPFGAGIAYLGNTVNAIRNNRNIDIILKYFVFYIISVTLFYPRSDARMLVREIVFYYVGFVVVTKIVTSIYKSNFRR